MIYDTTDIAIGIKRNSFGETQKFRWKNIDGEENFSETKTFQNSLAWKFFLWSFAEN